MWGAVMLGAVMLGAVMLGATMWGAAPCDATFTTMLGTPSPVVSMAIFVVGGRGCWMMVFWTTVVICTLTGAAITASPIITSEESG